MFIPPLCLGAGDASGKCKTISGKMWARAILPAAACGGYSLHWRWMGRYLWQATWPPGDQPKCPGWGGLGCTVNLTGDSMPCLGSFECGQAVEFSTDIGHATRNDHAAGTVDPVPGLRHPQDAQGGCGAGWHRRCGARDRSRAGGMTRCPDRTQPACAGLSFRGGRPRCRGGAVERRQALEQTGQSKQSDSHVKPFKSMEVGHRQD
jgi:hypothetical protein